MGRSQPRYQRGPPESSICDSPPPSYSLTKHLALLLLSTHPKGRPGPGVVPGRRPMAAVVALGLAGAGTSLERHRGNFTGNHIYIQVKSVRLIIKAVGRIPERK
uniref:Uncharacterized protein n=1 Tax=Macaca fascicularis TaxID=9541 RepID=Q9BGZ7_MACFA|nr:hypothetical protein [Macaca fascicularis]